MKRKINILSSSAALMLLLCMLVSCNVASSGKQLITPSVPMVKSAGELISNNIQEPSEPKITETTVSTDTADITDTEAPVTTPEQTPTASVTTTAPTLSSVPTTTRRELYQYYQFYYPSDSKKVAFSFDDGPYGPVTDIILDKISGTDDKVTFFVVGNRLTRTDSVESVKRGIAMGCEYGFHSWDHNKNYTDMTLEELYTDIEKVNQKLIEYGGNEITLLRPVGGSADSKQDYGYPCILWMKDNRDWEVYSNYKKSTMTEEEAVDALYNTILEQVKNGDIILMHDLYTTSALAFCKAYDTLKEQGYTFVTVSELLGITGQNTSGYSFYSTYAAYYLGTRCSNG